jgi:hypothetical protein
MGRPVIDGDKVNDYKDGCIVVLIDGVYLVERQLFMPTYIQLPKNMKTDRHGLEHNFLGCWTSTEWSSVSQPVVRIL